MLYAIKGQEYKRDVPWNEIMSTKFFPVKQYYMGLSLTTSTHSR